MTDDTRNGKQLYNLSRRRVLGGLGAVGLASAGAGLGTSAYFSDTESFQNNSITAGTVDLKVDWQQTYTGPAGLVPVNAYPDHDGDGLQSTSDGNEYDLANPGPIGTTCADLASGNALPADVFQGPNTSAEQDSLIALDDVKPGDSGEVTFSLHSCDNPAYVWLNGGLVSESENGVTEPEADSPNENAGESGGETDGDQGGMSTNSVGTTATGPLTATSMDTSGISAADLADNLIASTGGVSIVPGSVSYDGADVSAGTFSGGASTIGIDEGVILSSGDVEKVEGPNGDDGTTTNTGTDGDADLDTLSGASTYNAAVLTFDFTVPNDADKVYFQYVFGSEEYNEWVDDYNDVFGFFVNGTNVATVPDPDGTGTVPAAINNINTQDNAGLFKNNDPDSTNTPYDTEMDGFTTVLDIEADVTPGQTNTMKLAIADAGDAQLDSWVLIKGESVSTTPDPEPEPDTEGELLDAIQTRFWYDDGDNARQEDEEVFLGGSLGDALDALSTGRGVPLDGNQGDDFDELAGDPTAPERGCYTAAPDVHYLGFEWWVPSDVGNEIQTDSVEFDLGFYAEQCRHNDGSGPTTTTT